jgi:hypothetical protein
METKVFTSTPVDPILENACTSLIQYAVALARQEGTLYVHHVAKDIKYEEHSFNYWIRGNFDC